MGRGMLFIRGYKKNFFSLLLVLCLSHQAISKAHVCLNTFGTQNRFIKETEGLSDVNWSAREGWGVFKQEQIFTEKEIEFIRKKLESTKHIELNLINFKTNEVFQKANKLFGNIIASKLSDYVLEVLKLSLIHI